MKSIRSPLGRWHRSLEPEALHWIGLHCILFPYSCAGQLGLPLLGKLVRVHAGNYSYGRYSTDAFAACPNEWDGSFIQILRFHKKSVASLQHVHSYLFPNRENRFASLRFTSLLSMLAAKRQNFKGGYSVGVSTACTLVPQHSSDFVQTLVRTRGNFPIRNATRDKRFKPEHL